MEAIPRSETSVAACAKALTFTWISRFGLPKTITSDHGPQFTSNLWLQLCKMLNISHKQTTAYHPESNGAVERLHHHLKDALRARPAS
jgi:transposase InsO family protein